MQKFLLALVGIFFSLTEAKLGRNAPAVALMHGFTDTCFESTMIQTTAILRDIMQSSFVKCIPLGPTASQDSGNTYSLTMQQQVDVFAEDVRSSPSFQDGFLAVGMSQGTLIIRGYIQKYSWRPEYPTVYSFLAIHGPMMGMSSFGFGSNIIYSSFLQNSCGPCNYVRDPTNIAGYLTTNFLPYLNKEIESDDYVGLEDLEQLILVKADFETTIVPSESSWMGFYADGSLSNIESYDETIFYQNDMFGLRTLDEEGKLFFETTPTRHYVVTYNQWEEILNTYWLPIFKWEDSEPIF